MTPAQHEQALSLAREAESTGVRDAHGWVCARTIDPVVQEEVKRILAHQPTSAEGLAERPPARPMSTDPTLGLTLGGFRIERLIGSGGMGRVYLGVREGLPPRAAVKVLSRSGVTETAMRRFQQEADILARLDHPGIARLYASGMHHDGHSEFPWFAMEFIDDGADLTQWADARRLARRARLELFVRVCDAIAHAHAQGVVHRDLKPGNVLVDALGQVKVIDFGIARATHEDSARFGLRTETGQLVGTLQYMSPEQCLGLRDRIDARTDVYALGVILYELLTSTYPYDVRSVPMAEAIQTVTKGAVADLRESLSDAGDALAAAMARCLAKSPDGRHADAGELATALRAVLDARPATIDRARAPRVVPARAPVSAGRPRAGSRALAWTIAAMAALLAVAALEVLGVIDLRELIWRAVSNGP